MNLVHNAPIKRRNFKTDTYDDAIDTHYRDSSNKNRKFHTSVQDIHLWFHYLKLILEMEEKGLSFTKQNIKNPEIIDRSVIGSDITINKEKYVLWELEQVLRQPFSKWWKRHKYVFGSFKVQKLDNFQYEVMVLNYNIMVRYLNEESPFDIFISEKNRIRELRTNNRFGSRGWLNGKIEGKRIDGLELWTTYTRWWKNRYEPNTEVKMFDYKGESITRENPTDKGIYENRLIASSEKIVKNSVLETQDILLGVCSGSFVRKIKLTFDPKTGKRGIPNI